MKRKFAFFLAFCMIFTQTLPAWAETMNEGNIGAAALEAAASPSVAEKASSSDAEKASPSDAETATSSDALRDARVENVMYLDENGDEQTAECIIIDRDLDSLSLQADTWYAIEGEHNVAKRIENNAPEAKPAHLILMDGCKWSVPEGIHNRGMDSHYTGGKGLIIYSQSLEAGTEGALIIDQTMPNLAGIGGNWSINSGGETGGMLTVNGGTVSVKSGTNAIGSGFVGNGGGTITINGGHVEAEGGNLHCGIGSDGTIMPTVVVINGGEVIAKGGYCAPGIGVSLRRQTVDIPGKIEINGGSVTATGGTKWDYYKIYGGGAGIGGGAGSNGMTVEITGGTVYAEGHDGAAGIGGGSKGDTQSGYFVYGNGGDVTISGGSVTALGSEGNAGIGGGEGAKNHGTISLIYDKKADPRSELEILAGTNESDRAYIAVESYMATRYSYAHIQHVPGFRERHMGQNLAGDGYELIHERWVPGTTGSISTAVIAQIQGFVPQRMEDQKRIEADGSTCVEIYYSRNKSTISFDMCGHGTAPASITALYEAELTAPKAPTSKGYKFDGWYREKECTNKFDFTKEKMPAEDITLYAKWTQKSSGIDSADSGSGSSSGNGAGSALYSSGWYMDGAGNWMYRSPSGKAAVNTWICDDAVAANGKNVWYLIGTDGKMITAGLIQDSNDNFYSIETLHNGLFGMMRYQDGWYDCSGQKVYLTFNRNHDGSFGAVTNADGIEKLKAIYGVTKAATGSENCLYTKTF